MDRKHFDALIVSNKGFPFEDLKDLIKKNGWKSIFLLSSHLLFKTERETIRRDLADVNIEIKSFCDFLNDEEMENCDNEGTSFAEMGGNKYDEEYSCIFRNKSLELKNELVAKKLEQEISWDTMYLVPNLGVCREVWQKRGGLELVSDIYAAKGSRLKSFLKAIGILPWLSQLKKTLIFLFQSVPVTIIDDGKHQYIFFTTVKRLRFVEATKITNDSYRNIYYLRLKNNSAGQIAKRYVLQREKTRKIPAVIGSTIHAYNGPLLRNFEEEKVYLFADCNLPTNFPKMSLDSYWGIFVPKEVFGDIWFKAFNKKTTYPPAFIQRCFIAQEVTAPAKMNNIILLLQHSGDWCALLNQSDSDLLTESFVNLAKKLPAFNFIIRAHPTMTHPSHEGPRAIDRIRSLISETNLKNLSLSDLSLEEDLRRGDLFISEYSQTLLDIFSLGKLGIITTVVNRRSFMEDYIKLGFLNCDRNNFDSFISEVIGNPDKYIEIQSEAAARYNRLNNEFISGKNEK